jgi:TPR repeat protein
MSGAFRHYNRNIFIAAFLFISHSYAGNKFINNYVFEWSFKDISVVKDYLVKSTREPHVNAVASYVLGMLYIDGSILQKNLRMADCFLTIAANMGLPEAINAIGDGYYSGDIRPKDIKKALKYYEKAAEMGFGPAQFNAGIVLFRTYKNKYDLRKAILYLDKASKNGNDLGEVARVALKYKTDAEHKFKKYM